MSLPKPKFCDQDWLEMEPTEKGRICGKCQNELLDFRKMSWSKIRQIQNSSNNSTCGLYSKKQLKNWDPEPKPSNKFTIAAASVLFGMSQLISSEGIAQEDTTITIEPIETDSSSSLSPSSQKYVVRGKVFDGETQEPIPFAKIMNERLKKGAFSDLDGSFIIEFEEEDWKDDQLKLLFKYVGQESQEIILKKTSRYPHRLEIFMAPSKEIIYFTIAEPNKRKLRKVKRKLKTEERREKRRLDNL